MESNIQISLKDTGNILKEIEQAFFDIPFENSKFQTEAFVISAQITPQRAYRAIGLRMHAKLRALNEAKFAIQNQQIELDEIDYLLSSGTLNQFDTRRQELKRDKILSEQAWSTKLINDALAELNVLYKHFKALPKYTREEFEAGEKLHFEQKLTRALAGIEGARESLINVREDTAALEYFEQLVSSLPETQASDPKLVLGLPNILHPAQQDKT